MRRKKFIRLAMTAAAVLCGVFALWMGCRSLLRDEALSRLQARCAARGLSLQFTAPRWSGWRTVQLDTLWLYQADKLCARLTGVEASPAFSALWSEPACATFTVASAWIDGDALPRRSSGVSNSSADHPLWKLAASVETLQSRLGTWQISEGTLVLANEAGQPQSLHFLAHGGGGGMQARVSVPGIWEWKGAFLSAPRAQATVILKKVSASSFLLGCRGELPAGLLFHAALSADTLGLREARLHGWAQLTPAGIQSLPGATLSHAGAMAEWQLRWQNAVECVLTVPPQRVDALIASAPGHFFTMLHSGSCEGSLSGWTSLCYTPGQPRSLHLSGNWQSHELALSRDHCLHRLNGEALSLPPGETIKINKTIPPQLAQAVVLAEDPDFFEGDGLSADMVRTVALDNLAHGRFQRGGSTLPMQVMRNAFLNLDKTLSRKAEEVLLTWLNEESKAVSREQMLRVYLSLAEWGPGIRGAEAAADFYFGKKAEALSTDECIFLAGLLPNPRAWRSQLDANGELRPFVRDYFSGMRLQLVDAGWLQPEALERPISLRFRREL